MSPQAARKAKLTVVPAAAVKKIRLGKLYEIPGDGNDRFFAIADGHCVSQGLVRLLIESPPRWRGCWTGCRPENCRPAKASQLLAEAV